MDVLFATHEETTAPPAFDTVRVLDVQRLRRSLKRRTAANGDDALRFDTLLRAIDPPRVVIVSWDASEAPLIEYSLFGETVLIGAHLSPTWDETKLSPQALRAIAAAMTAQERIRSRPVYNIGEI